MKKNCLSCYRGQFSQIFPNFPPGKHEKKSHRSYRGLLFFFAFDFRGNSIFNVFPWGRKSRPWEHIFKFFSMSSQKFCQKSVHGATFCLVLFPGTQKVPKNAETKNKCYFRGLYFFLLHIVIF